jgi:hypothetical protein
VRALGQARGFCLALKARRGVQVLAGLGAQELERHTLTDGSIRGLEHRAHAAAPDQTIDVVLACDRGAYEQIQLVELLVPTIEGHASP